MNWHKTLVESHARAFSVCENLPAQDTVAISEQQRANLEALIEKWRFQYRKRFADAQHEPTEFGRRFIEHGGWNIHNCMCELERALSGQAGEAGQATGDLPLQVVQQDAKSP